VQGQATNTLQNALALYHVSSKVKVRGQEHKHILNMTLGMSQSLFRADTPILGTHAGPAISVATKLHLDMITFTKDILRHNHHKTPKVEELEPQMQTNMQ
jgi:hypothetical protein